MSKQIKVKELLNDYRANHFSIGSYYIDTDGNIYDLGNSGYGHAEVSTLLNDNGLEVDYEVSKASKLLKSFGWIRLNTKLNFIELPDIEISNRQEQPLKEAIEIMKSNILFGDTIQISYKNEVKTYAGWNSEDLWNRILKCYQMGKL